MDLREGLPVVARGGQSAITTNFAFWGKDWVWATPKFRTEVLAPLRYASTGRIELLDLDVSMATDGTGRKKMTWRFHLAPRAEKADVIGGGVVFRLDTETFALELGKPELLPANQGWTWGSAKGPRFEFRFDPPPESVHFERGRTSEIRAFFFRDRLPKEPRSFFMTLTLPDEATARPSVEERFGPVDERRWVKDMLDWRTSPVDLSFLNAREKPAGRRGFVRANGENLQFADGTIAKFWGVNLTAASLFRTPEQDVRQQARRLSQLGVNLVRLHHHDSHWVSPNIFGAGPSSQSGNPDPAMLEKIDWWIKCLKDEGIYVWLDLHVGRRLNAADGIESFDEIRKGQPLADLRGFNYVNAQILERMKSFNEAYVSHRNKYTGLRYRDDPAIIAMLVTNENDVTQHFGNAMLPDKNVPRHTALYLAAAREFAERHRLPYERVWRSWEHGPSKLFLNDLERRFNVSMISYLRRHGVRVPVATTSTWGNNPISSLPALTVGEIIDAHAYGGVGELERDPRYAASMTHWLAAAQVAGKPFSVTEWNTSPFPVPDRHTAALYIASLGSLQGWDAVMQYAYAQVPLSGPGRPSNWASFNDPSMIGTMPAAALLFRAGHIQESRKVYAFTPSREQLFFEAISPRSSVALRSVAERGKLVIVMPEVAELPWLRPGEPPVGAERIVDPKHSVLPLNAREVRSDTNELWRDWRQGIATINTPKTQAALGWVGGKRFALSDIELEIHTRNATIAVQSMDEHPISRSDKILISLAARSVPMDGNAMPFLSEPVEGRLFIKAARGLKLYGPLVRGGTREELRTRFVDGRYEISLSEQLQTYWLTLERPQRSH